MKDNFSRRNFLRATFLGLMAAFLSACEWLIKPKALPKAIVAPINTDTPEPTATDTSIATPTATATQTPTQLACFQLLGPEDGITIPAMGKVTFAWGTMQGAVLYRLEITMPNGTIIPFETEYTSLDRYAESMPMAGTYHWQVIALDTNGGSLCTADSFSFLKPENSSNPKIGGSGATAGGAVVGQTVGGGG